ncbi:MAG: hypothetical protein ABIG71_00520 [Candidatus Uhrbacteria bacterium]
MHGARRWLAVVELFCFILIVVALGSAVFVGARANSRIERDRQRAGDVAAIERALADYLAKHGSYPLATEQSCLSREDRVSSLLIAADVLDERRADPVAPQVEPNSNEELHCYAYQSSDGSGYMLRYSSERDGEQAIIR